MRCHNQFLLYHIYRLDNDTDISFIASATAWQAGKSTG
ncbi:hypothetical protein RU86_GL001309 [Lactococcus piscium]|uniref:Uncharacterized protein n=1 Tax=Pseudolactococcus piscium TaxID=1364 RepID=A0A2A5RV16_9LACT|nr:hypothetical protein RU86_GL001309 [Lactococcus piscium]